MEKLTVIYQHKGDKLFKDHVYFWGIFPKGWKFIFLDRKWIVTDHEHHLSENIVYVEIEEREV